MTGVLQDTNARPIGGRVSWLPRGSEVLPSYTNVDVRVAKQFVIRERINIELRGELFNLFNSTIVQSLNQNAYNFVGVGSGVCAGHTNTCLVPLSTFQQATTTTGNLLGARQVQFGFRFSF